MSAEWESGPCKTCGKPSGDRGTHFYKGDKIVGFQCCLCVEKERVQNFENTGHITTQLVMEANLVVFEISRLGMTSGDRRRFHETYERVAIQAKLIHSRHCKDFESRVWFDGLNKIVKDSKYKGLSASYENHRILTYAIAGRVMFTFQGPEGDHGHSVTLITTEDDTEARMGVQGFDCTYQGAANLIQTIIMGWRCDKLNFVTDNEIGIAGT